MTWIEISIAAGLFLTLRNALARALTGQMSSVLLSWARFAFNLPFSVLAVVSLTIYSGAPRLPFAFFWYCLLTGVTQIVANLALVSAFRHANFAQAIILYKLEILFTALFGLCFFAEAPSPFGWTGILAATGGFVLMNLGRTGNVGGWRAALRLDWGTLLSLVAAVFLVLASFLLKEATAAFAAANPRFGASRFEAAVYTVFHTTWMEVVVLTAWVARFLPDEWRKLPVHWRRMALIGAASFGGSVCAFWSYSLTLVVYAKALAQVEAVAAIVLALVVWREREVWRQLPGMALVLAGIGVILLG